MALKWRRLSRVGFAVAMGIILSGCFLGSHVDPLAERPAVTPLPQQFRLRVFMANNESAAPIFTFRGVRNGNAYRLSEEASGGRTAIQGDLKFADAPNGRLAFSFGDTKSYLLGLARIESGIITLQATAPTSAGTAASILAQVQRSQGLLRRVTVDPKGSWIFPDATSWDEFAEATANGRMKPEPREDVAVLADPDEPLPEKLVKVAGVWRPDGPSSGGPQASPGQPAPPPPLPSDWKMSEKRDPFHDRLVTTAWLDAKESAGAQRPARIYLTCNFARPREADVRVDFGVRLHTRLIGERRKMSLTDIRFDKRAAQQYGWKIVDSQTQLVVFDPLEASLAKLNIWPDPNVNLDWTVYSFMQDLLTSRELMIQMTSAAGTRLFARFEIGNADAVVNRIRKGCPPPR